MEVRSLFGTGKLFSSLSDITGLLNTHTAIVYNQSADFVIEVFAMLILLYC
jgi:hypothetical protein